MNTKSNPISTTNKRNISSGTFIPKRWLEQFGQDWYRCENQSNYTISLE